MANHPERAAVFVHPHAIWGYILMLAAIGNRFLSLGGEYWAILQFSHIIINSITIIKSWEGNSRMMLGSDQPFGIV